MQERFDYIDGFRGLAIFGVILTHVSSIVDYEGFLSPFTRKLGLGVQLFFLVSAFTIFFTLDKSKGKESFLFSNFFIKRIFRIAPIYWFGIIFYTIIYGFNSRGWLPGPEIWHYPLHFSFTNSLHPETPSSVVPGGWSISVEVLFYLMCPMLFTIVTSLKRALTFCVFSLLIGVGFLGLVKPIFFEGIESLYGAKIAHQYFYRNIFSQLTCFSFGILLFHIYKYEKLKYFLSSNINYYGLLLVSLALFSLTILDLIKGINHYIGVASFFTFALCCYARRNFIVESKAFTFLGRISYSAYIFHFAVITLLFEVLGSYANFYSLTIATLICVIPISYISFKFIETETTNLAKKIVKNREVKKKKLEADTVS